MDEEKIEIELPLGYMLDRCSDFDALCAELGLNPWLLNEGLANSADTHPITVAQCKRHGVFR